MTKKNTDVAKAGSMRNSTKQMIKRQKTFSLKSYQNALLSWNAVAVEIWDIMRIFVMIILLMNLILNLGLAENVTGR